MDQLRQAAATVRRGAPAGKLAQAFEQAFDLCESLDRELAYTAQQSERTRAARAAETDRFLEVMPVACVEIDRGGRIVHANRAAATLLNTSSKHLIGRLLLHFAEDRDPFRAFLQRLAFSPNQQTLSCALRPRERARLPAEWTAMAQQNGDVPTSLVFIAPAAVTVREVRRPGRSAAASLGMLGEAADERRDMSPVSDDDTPITAS